VRIVRFITILCGLLALSSRTSAQTPQPIENVTVDAAQGPVTGSTRVIGLGGAFVAVAEGMDGVSVNPASAAVRVPYSWHRWDYGFGIHFAIGGWLPKTDFLNRAPAEGQTQPAPEVEQRSLLFGSVGATVHFEHAGMGASAEGQQQALQSPGDTQAGLAPRHLTGNFGIVHASIGYGFFDGQFVVGVGPRITGVSFSRGSSTSDLLSVAGVGYQVGFVYKPIHEQVRVGATYKSQITPSLDSDPNSQQTVFRATALRLPWQGAAGLAYQFGPRPFNPPLVTLEDRIEPFVDELERREAERERELERAEATYELEPTPANGALLAQTKARLRREEEADERRLSEREDELEDALRNEYLARPRFYVLVTTEVLVLGTSPGSVDLASFYQDSTNLQRSGESHTLSGRFGVETEAVPDWLKLRAGTYLEPARVSIGRDRVHGTFGFDLKTFSWDVFGLIGDFDSWVASAAVDYARDYLSTSFSIGFWH